MASIVKGSADYYPFGSQFPDRKDLDYRYAYQGQEKDAETGMEAFELRLWDSRIGRWLTPDPYGQHASPYLGMGNNPISRIDPDGGEDGDGWFKRVFNKIFGKTNEETEGYIDEVVITGRKNIDMENCISCIGEDKSKGAKEAYMRNLFNGNMNFSIQGNSSQTLYRNFVIDGTGRSFSMGSGWYRPGDEVLYIDWTETALPGGGAPRTNVLSNTVSNANDVIQYGSFITDLFKPQISPLVDTAVKVRAAKDVSFPVFYPEYIYKDTIIELKVRKNRLHRIPKEIDSIESLFRDRVVEQHFNK